MRAFLGVLLVLVAAGCSTSKPSTSGAEARILEQRIAEIRRQAPLLGIPVDRALAGRVRRVNLCQETGRNGDGSFVCGDKSECAQVPDCVHAWCATTLGASVTEYMFAQPVLHDWCIAHEVHHELVVRYYGIGGHPRRSTITRITDGRTVQITHAEIIKGRWPSLVNWALPASAEVGLDWGGDFQCGTGEVFIDGGGI